MLSYIVPQSCEEKSLPPRSLNLNHNLNNLTTSTLTSSSTDNNFVTTTTTTTTTTVIESMDANAPSPISSNVKKININETTKLLSNERLQNPTQSDKQNLKNNSSSTTTIMTTKKASEITTKRTFHQQDSSDTGGGGGGGGDSSDDPNASGTASNGSGQDEGKNQMKKGKMSKIGAKNTTLKRVSFGSSKGSMVETLIFETPTPLPEHAERVFGYTGADDMNNASSSSATPVATTTINPAAAATTTSVVSQHHHHYHPHHVHHIHGHRTSTNLNPVKITGGTTTTAATTTNNTSSCLDDSGIDLQEESERSKVRVTFFESNQPQQVSPPDSYLFYSDSLLGLLPDSYLLEGDMASVETAAQITYDRQISTESGWDNPFRPGGDLSREADEIVNLIKGGKPITPTGDANQSIANGQTNLASHSIENGKTVIDGATKSEVSHLQSTQNAQNGTKSSSQSKTDAKSASQTQVSNQVVPGPTSASHVVIQDKKKKKCNCCVIQ